MAFKKDQFTAREKLVGAKTAGSFSIRLLPERTKVLASIKQPKGTSY